MPTFEITSPDGRKFRVDAPEGATQQDALAHVQQSQQESPSNADSNLGGTLQLGIPFTGARFDTGLKMSPAMEAGLVGAGKTTQRLIQGVRQAMPGNNSVLDAQVAQENAAYDPLAKAHPIATTVGEIAPYMVTANPLAMAGMSAAEYGTPGERAARAGLAYGGAKVGQGVARLFGPQSMNPVASTAGDFVSSPLNAGNKWGIPLRMAQTTDSKPIQIMDAVAANLPISSGVIAKAKDASFQGFNRAVGETFGADTTKITPELLGQYRSNIGRTIGDLAKRNTLTVDQDFAQQIAQISTRAQNDLTDAEAKLVNNQITQIVNRIDPQTGTIPGTVYKAYDSALGKLASGNKGTVKDVLGELRGAMRDAMDRSISPQDAAAWKTARKQYFNLNQVADSQAANPGVLSPTQLMASVNRNQRNARFGAGNDLAELAQWAKPILGDAIPNSGTAQRAWYQNLMTNPLTTIGTAGGALYGGNELGVSPIDAGAGLLGTYAAARGMAGKPASELMKKLLMQSGGLLGLSAAP